MANKLVDCDHCKGRKNCTASGGKSCRICMEAAGMGRKQWATVRCSYCGGRGKVWMEEEAAPEGEAAATEGGAEKVEEEKPAEGQ